MAKYNFNEDLILGEEGEQAVVRDLTAMGGTFISDNKDNRYDVLISMNNKEISYEIKTDVLCKPESDTNNLFVEFESRGKYSGISVTQADWYVNYYKFLREIWYIKTQDLKDLIEKENFPKTEFSGDKGSNTKGYLIPRYPFKSHFIVRRVPRKPS